MSDNDNVPFPFPVSSARVEFDHNRNLRELMDAAKVATSESMPQAQATETLLALRALLALIERNMPPELQQKDTRIQNARTLMDHLVRVLQ